MHGCRDGPCRVLRFSQGASGPFCSTWPDKALTDSIHAQAFTVLSGCVSAGRGLHWQVPKAASCAATLLPEPSREQH